MPYGTASEETKDILRQGNMMKALDLPEREGDEEDYEQNPTIDVILDGALDEMFEVLELWAVNVVDLIADYLQESYQGVDWQVIAYYPGDRTIYENNSYQHEDD